MKFNAYLILILSIIGCSSCDMMAAVPKERRTDRPRPATPRPGARPALRSALASSLPIISEIKDETSMLPALEQKTQKKPRPGTPRPGRHEFSGDPTSACAPDASQAARDSRLASSLPIISKGGEIKLGHRSHPPRALRSPLTRYAQLVVSDAALVKCYGLPMVVRYSVTSTTGSAYDSLPSIYLSSETDNQESSSAE